MTSTSKKLLTALLAVLAAVCLSIGLLFTAPKAASAAETLSTASYFNISSDGVLSGLSDAGKAKADEGKINIVIPSDVTTIGARAFYGCTAIEEITIPSDVTSIGSSAFSGCTSLKTINYNAVNANPLSTSTASPFSNSGREMTLNIGQGTNQVQNIPSYFFRGTGLTTVNFNSANLSITGFGTNAFLDCSSLTTVNFATGVTVVKIPDHAFEGCTSLSNITLPDSVVTIGVSAFYSCPSLYKINLPANLGSNESETAIGDSAFGGGTKLLEIINKSSTISLTAGSSAYGGVAANVISSDYIHSGDTLKLNNLNQSGYIFMDGTGNSGYLVRYVGTDTALTLPDGTYKIRQEAFAGNSSITGVVIPSGVSEIGNNAFEGCVSLESVNIPTTVNQIGSSVFNGCTSLKTVNIPDGISNLENYLFSGCTSLETIVLPASTFKIGNSAFKGCTSLASVTFEGNNTSLNTIDTSAFENCTGLTMVKLPAKLSGTVKMGGLVFSGCTNLTTVYLPAKIEIPNQSSFQGCASGLILIATGKDSYKYYDNNGNGALSTYNLTYIVDIKLVYGTHTAENPDTAKKLFGEKFIDYTVNADGSLTDNAEKAMPVQEGYAKSVWYTDSTYATKIDKTSLAAKLDDIDWDATIYAQVLSVPTLTARDDLVYGGTDSTNNGFGFNTVFDGALDEKYSCSITNYLLVSGAAAALPANIKDAGTYELLISIADENTYGQWGENPARAVTVYVSPAPYQISDCWTVKGGSSLLPADETTNLYVYGDTPYLDILANGGNTYSTIPVLSSYLLYTGSALEIVWSESGNDVPYTVEKYEGNTGRGVGSYTASVMLKANNNFTLTLTLDTNTQARGLSLTSGPNSTYLISKDWYIVSDSSIALMTEDGTPYMITDWTYLLSDGEKIPTAPVYSDSENEGDTHILTYTLLLNTGNEGISAVIFEKERLDGDKFGEWFNSSMPAGAYSLTVIVDDGAYMQNFSFNVKPASLTKILSNSDSGVTRVDGWLDAENKLHYLNETQYKIADDKQIHLDDGTPYLYITTLSVSEINPREGNWALNKFKDYYSQCVITYNVQRTIGDIAQNTTNYYPAGELLGTSVVPNTMGKYRVYYNITASNFQPLVDVNVPSERTAYSYLLSIYGEIKLPTISALEYNKTAQTFDFSGDENYRAGYYQVIKLDKVGADSQTAVQIIGQEYHYTEAGPHVLALRIQNTFVDTCQWAGNVVMDVTGTYALLTVQIKPASNSVSKDLSIISWQWGNWDRTINSPVWKTEYGNAYTYELFNVDTGKTSPFSEVETVDAGNYELIATVRAEKNWESISQRTSFVILKATVSWDESPYIESWKYGEYNTRRPVAEGVFNESFRHLNVVDNYYSLDDVELSNPYESLESMRDKAGEIPAGSYVRIYSLEGNANYYDWEYRVHFSVLKSDNYWTTTPIVQNWRYGEFAERGKDPAAVPRFEGSINYSYIKLRTDGTPDSSSYKSLGELVVGLEGENGKELPVGKYSLTVTVTGTANYEMREPTVITFEVLKGENSWVEIPSIISWSESNYSSDKNYPISQAMFGEAEYTILELDKNGEVINEYDISQIRSLGVGSYKLKVYVEGNDNYDDLTAYATFAVFEDSVGMTGLIAATMVFAVIAVGLAVCGVILLIRRNRKIEQAFRRMIKSELHRR